MNNRATRAEIEECAKELHAAACRKAPKGEVFVTWPELTGAQQEALKVKAIRHLVCER